jgi:regulator of extracellular matrix RemA (YlzA/DUF370 family)
MDSDHVVLSAMSTETVSGRVNGKESEEEFDE